MDSFRFTSYFDSFTSHFYKISLIKCLIDRTHKINDTWASFHYDVTEIKETLKRNSFAPFLIDRITKSYLNKVHSNTDRSNPDLIKHVFINFHTLENIQSKFGKCCQESLNSSAKMLILKLFLLLLKLITISHLKIKHLIYKSFLVYKFLQDVILVILAKPAITLKLVSMSM